MKRATHIQISMPHSESIIRCSNPHCQNYNDLKSRFCQKCKTPVIKRYLWSTGEQQWSEGKNIETKVELESSTKAVEENNGFLTTEAIPKQSASKTILDKRYVKIREIIEDDRKSGCIYLDTQPGETPQTPSQLAKEIINYLQLSPYFPHIPQIYGQLDGTNTWLLDYGTVPIDRDGKLVFDDLLPGMASLWDEASYLRQIKWLRQIIGLWKPLAAKGMVATLLNPHLLRVNGSLIQIRELEKDRDIKPTLQELGKLWQEWSEKAHPIAKDVLVQLSKRIAIGAIDNVEQIIDVLDRSLDFCAKSHEYSYEVFAMSDPGPTREKNQDTAYPDSEILTKVDPEQQSLAIVCDGVGGHEGGEIASQETVSYLQESVSTIDWNREERSPKDVIKHLAQFTNEANDAISQRNDSELREERQRMGTTLVMSLARDHEVYLTHVGDSRIYLITKDSCHQVTIDDDLASREVRLGYAVYRDALRYPSAGALIQALGMRDSAALHPNVKRLLIDDDCLLLLCSDGLSDFDRVEQYWRDVVLPVLDGKLDLKRSVQTLIKIGNKRNGHDNITAALVHCRVAPKPETSTFQIAWSDVESVLGDSVLWMEDSLADSTFSITQEVTTTPEEPFEEVSEIEEKPKMLFSPIVITLGVIFILSLGLLIYASTKKDDESKDNSAKSHIGLLLK